MNFFARRSAGCDGSSLATLIAATTTAFTAVAIAPTATTTTTASALATLTATGASSFAAGLAAEAAALWAVATRAAVLTLLALAARTFPLHLLFRAGFGRLFSGLGTEHGFHPAEEAGGFGCRGRFVLRFLFATGAAGLFGVAAIAGWAEFLHGATVFLGFVVLETYAARGLRRSRCSWRDRSRSRFLGGRRHGSDLRHNGGLARGNVGCRSGGGFGAVLATRSIALPAGGALAIPTTVASLSAITTVAAAAEAVTTTVATIPAVATIAIAAKAAFAALGTLTGLIGISQGSGGSADGEVIFQDNSLFGRQAFGRQAWGGGLLGCGGSRAGAAAKTRVETRI
jgi:hypothetical protein